jgi:hypothetical protein
MLLALDYILQWPPIHGNCTSGQTQVTHSHLTEAILYEYVADVYITEVYPLIWYFNVDGVISCGGSADTQYISGTVSDITISGDSLICVTKTYKPSGDVITVSGDAICEFVESTHKKQRGGKSLYQRKRVAQPHRYVYDYGITSEDMINLSGQAVCEFKQAPRYEFIRSISTPIRPKTVFSYEAEIGTNSISEESLSVFVDQFEIQNIRDEDEIMMLLDDCDINSDVLVYSFYDKPTIKNIDDDELLQILGLT